MDHHTLAAVSITGACLDVVGSLYLAYNLLGGQHGPLRLLTRAVTYALVFGIGYGLGLGLFFDVASGLATGITISIELNRPRTGSFLSALGSSLRCRPRVRLRPWIAPACGLRVCNLICNSQHRRPDPCLFTRHAPGSRLCLLPWSTPYTPPVLGSRHPYGWLHCFGSC